ncbi:hypothetical protein HYFRA_00002597 [Hymenoscyphus fraxineus]|uniref:Uncharacterized protein n=1 Tax=Hymenoscyphus fraxineus TaxID=746836 RepID=A0A9N9PZ47_9HELO|nr:hypothetical protein HYFRA_00002597 [Hymenoscyphus fraxineus]
MSSRFLSPETTTRYIQLDFAQRPVEAEHSVGIEAATRAIYDAQTQISPDEALVSVIKHYVGTEIDISSLSIAEKNAALASLAREVVNENTWLDGYKVLAKACPGQGMHSTLIDDGNVFIPITSTSPKNTTLCDYIIIIADHPSRLITLPSFYCITKHIPLLLATTNDVFIVSIGVEVFQNVKVHGEPRRTIDDIDFSMVAHPTPGDIYQIGPKNIGGRNWEDDKAFHAAAAAWHAPGDLKMGPCPFFAWIGVAKKVPQFCDEETSREFWNAQLLGIVDYDFDKDDKKLKGGIGAAVERCAVMATKMEGSMRGTAWIGLLTMDQQMFNREIQMKWVAEQQGSYVIGPSQIKPYDFACAGYIDCAALAPFAYQSAEQLESSRKSMFVAVIFANMHDLLFDMGCSSRISEAAYADSTGAFDHDLPQAFVVGYIDAIAKLCRDGGENYTPTYGANALLAVCVWDIFNVRYKAWERLVKYTRMLQRSNSNAAAGILKRAKEGKVLIPEPNADIGEAFNSALDPNNATKLVARNSYTQVYTLGDPSKVLEKHGVVAPLLARHCMSSCQEAFLRENDTIEAISGLPDSVVFSDCVAISAAIRRVSLWATTSECCDSCACAIGLWGNDMSDRAVVALMESEQKSTSREWLLQNYLMGCVAFSPLRLMSVTAGFDLNVDVKFAPGAMGERDIVHEE